MRPFLRLCSALALVLAAVLVPSVASAKPQPAAKAAKWAKKNRLTGSWRGKDADRDGLKNLNEFKLGTNPRKADSDRDGLKDGDEVAIGDDPTDPDTDGDKIKDGAEHAGVVTAFDGKTVTIRQFKGGKLTAALAEDAVCYAADDSADETPDDSGADDEGDDDGYVGDDSDAAWSDDDGGDDDLGADAATVDDDETEVDLGADESSAVAPGCGDAGIENGALVRSVELEGGAIVAVELAF